MAGYTRQSAANIVNGGVIDADDFNDEYNAIEAAFNASTGHKHDGTAGNGPPIEDLGPSQDLSVTSSTLLPKISNTLDLGTSGVQFKNGYFDGQLNTDTLLVDETSTLTGDVTAVANVSIGGNLTVTGDATINGNLTFGDADTDSVTFGADIDSSILPNVDDTYDLGSATKEWRDLYVDGTANIDALVADTADINGGTIDNTVIGGAVAAAGSFTTLSATSGITGDLTGDVTGDVTGNVTGTLDGVVGGTTPAAGTFTTLTTTGNATIGGNLTVSGTTTTVNTETINLADNIILINSNEAGAPTQNGGIEIERGTSTNKTLVWDESADKWTVGSETFVAGTFQGNLTGNVTGNVTGSSGSTTGNAATATKLATARTITLTGAVTGSTTFDGSANVSIATTATADPTLTLTGDATGSATFTNLGNASLAVTIVDDSHNHIISNVDGLQTALDAKLATAGGVMTGSLRFNDNIAVNLGTGSDAEFYFSGSALYLDMNSDYDFFIRDGNSANATRFTFDTSTGNFTATGDVTAYSDARLKSDIVTIPNALDKVKALRGVNFNKDGKASTGVIAQEVQEVIPEVINTNGEYLAVAYGNLVGVLIEAVKELSAEVEALKAK